MRFWIAHCSGRRVLSSSWNPISRPAKWTAPLPRGLAFGVDKASHWKLRRGVYSRHGTPIFPPARDDRNAAYYVALVFSAQSAKGRPSRRQSRRVPTRIQDRLRCSPIIYGVFFHCRDSRFQMVVCRDGFVVGNAGIFYLQSLGLVLVLAAERASEFRPIPQVPVAVSRKDRTQRMRVEKKARRRGASFCVP
jgi:hypothetical protein